MIFLRLAAVPTGAPDEPHCGDPTCGCPTNAQMDAVFRAMASVPRKLKCAGCQLGEHCNGEDDGCYCECVENAPSV